jgi:hypothetical protein
MEPNAISASHPGFHDAKSVSGFFPLVFQGMPISIAIQMDANRFKQAKVNAIGRTLLMIA